MSNGKKPFKEKAKKLWYSFFRNFGVYTILGLFCSLWWPKLYYESDKAREDAKKKGTVIIANHSNPLDPVLIFTLAKGKHLSVMTAKEVLTGFKGTLLKIMGCVSVDREVMDLQSMRECERRVKNGEKLGLFPEGRINFDEELLEFKAGATLIAAHTKAEIIPVCISGDFRPFGHIKLMVGEAIDLTEVLPKVPNALQIASATELLSNRVLELRGKLYAQMSEKELEGMRRFRAKFKQVKDKKDSAQQSETEEKETVGVR
ncbi:MAG: lysophospholipid acyltransferase family protein [Ruminococcus sp.]